MPWHQINVLTNQQPGMWRHGMAISVCWLPWGYYNGLSDLRIFGPICALCYCWGSRKSGIWIKTFLYINFFKRKKDVNEMNFEILVFGSFLKYFAYWSVFTVRKNMVPVTWTRCTEVLLVHSKCCGSRHKLNTVIHRDCAPNSKGALSLLVTCYFC